MSREEAPLLTPGWAEGVLVRVAVRGVLALVLMSGSLVAADPPPAPPGSPYGDTYTAAELAALDRVLHAGNLTREDLTFQKDMAKGTGCLPAVKAMLRDPLLIAPAMDRIVGALGERAAAWTPDWVVGLLAWDGAARLSGSSHIRGGTTRGVAATEAALDDLAALLAPDRLFGGGAGGAPIAPDDLALLRGRLPDEMLMREVIPSPFGAEADARVRAGLKEQAPDRLYRLADSLSVQHLVWGWAGCAYAAMDAWPRSVFPTDRPAVRDTPSGRIALGTLKDDVYTGDYAVIIDPGGNDRYEHGRFAAAYGTDDHRVGLLIDLGGNDTYDCGDVDVTLGAAVLGVALLADLGRGNDRYVGGHLSLGAAVGGVAMLYDDGGSDTYDGKTFTQGAAGFGIGILYDDSVGPPLVLPTDDETKDPIEIARWDNDRLHAWCCAQAFARTGGVALCINTRGNEVYEAGGVYLHAPLFADRYQSFSQGFAIGSREIDWAGGLAMLIDRAGNDRYLGDIYDQGVGYWYSAGLLWDGGGNDVYEMTQYGQGSGIHLAVGGLVDVSGSDCYVMHSGLGQGGSHDFAASVLHDRGGNDQYDGNTSCNGCGLTNSVGLFLDRGGDDTYTARRDGGLNAGRPARGFGSVGLFVDLGGKDDYLGPLKDDAQWRDSDVGLGIDLATAPEAPGAGAAGPERGTGAAPAPGRGGTSEPNQVTGKAEIPEVCRYEGPLTPKVFDELWAIAIRWEVGDNRVIVPEARKRLIAFGKDVIASLDGKLGDTDTGLAVRAHLDVLKGLTAAGAGAEVLGLLTRNLGAADEDRRRAALVLVGELKVREAEAGVVSLLGGADGALARRAAGVLQMLGSHAGDGRLTAWLGSEDERMVMAALGTLLGLDSDVYPAVRRLAAHPMVSVRTRLATLLAEHRAQYGPAVLADLASEDLGARGRRALLDAVVRGPIAPDAAAVATTVRLLAAADWGTRADAARALKAWLDMKDAVPAVVEPGRKALASLLESESDPFVRASAGAAPLPPRPPLDAR